MQFVFEVGLFGGGMWALKSRREVCGGFLDFARGGFTAGVEFWGVGL
jgi:hypothetical protein